MTTKRNTISVTLPDEDYDALKALAEEQDRYISGQARHMLRKDLAFEAAIRARAGIQPEAPPDQFEPHRCCGAPIGGPHQVGCDGAQREDRTSSAPPVPSATYVEPEQGASEAKQAPLPG